MATPIQMNRKQFETSIPEIYTKVIPKYFTEKENLIVLD